VTSIPKREIIRDIKNDVRIPASLHSLIVADDVNTNLWRVNIGKKFQGLILKTSKKKPSPRLATARLHKGCRGYHVPRLIFRLVRLRKNFYSDFQHLADFVVGFGQLHLPFIALYSPQPPIVSIVKAKSCNSMQNIVSRFISHRMLFAKAITPISTNNAFLIISTFFIFVVVFSCYLVYYSS